MAFDNSGAFFKDLQQIGLQWYEQPIITDPNAFEHVPGAVATLWAKAKHGFTHQGELPKQLPALHGRGCPQWWQRGTGQYVVAKDCIYGDYKTRDTLDDGSELIRHVGAREKIASDLAHELQLPVPATGIWLKPHLDLSKKYKLVSPQALPDAQDYPIDEILLADPHFLRMVVFNCWIRNVAFGPEHILCSPAVSQLAYHHHGEFMSTNYIAGSGTHHAVGVLRKFSEDVQKYARTEILGSNRIAKDKGLREFINGLQQFPKDTISKIVDRLPKDLFEHPDAKRELPIILYERSRNLPRLLARDASLNT